MREAVIVEVTRTPVGKIRQSLASFGAHELGAMAVKSVIEKTGIKPTEIDDIIFGNLFNFNWGNIARVIALEAGFPFSVSAMTLDRQCGSSLNAVGLGASLIMTGSCDVILAGGVESYSQMPIMIERPEVAYPGEMKFIQIAPSIEKIGNPPMIITAENLAKKYNISREECDAFAVESHRKAAAAWDRGFFDNEVFPVEIPQKKGKPKLLFKKDECIRPEASIESLAQLKPVMLAEGVVTAGNSSPMNDGASAVLLMSREKAKEHHLEPLAKVIAFASAGVDPNIMGIGPVYSTRKLMKMTGYTIDDFDVIEMNEAFAAQSIACTKELGIENTDRLNPNGGAIAIGHPNAASGGILTARTVGFMREQNLKRGLITFCIGGGQGYSLIVERD